MSDAMLIVAALNGTRTPDECPKVPITVEEIAAEAKRVVDAGAAVVHVHARKKDGGSAFDLVIDDLMQAIRAKVDVPISITTQRTRSTSLGTVTALFDVLRHPPDLATISVRPPEPDMPAHREEARQILEACDRAGVRPEPVVISVDSLSDFEQLYQDSLLQRMPYVIVELGTSDGRASDRSAGTPNNVLRMKDACSAAFSRFDVVMSGQDEASPNVQAVAAAAGCHVRCGFQDAPTLPDGSAAASNAQLVEIAVRLAEAVGRPVMEPSDVRALLR
jgi:3-keto-5-aminohexanoate cleavage enzyme